MILLGFINNNYYHITMWKKYILWFAQEHVDFRYAEFESITKLLNLQYQKLSDNLLKPFWIVEFPDDKTALQLASRSVALRCVFELWSHSQSISSFHQMLQKYIKLNDKHVKYYFTDCKSFKITVETYNKHLSQIEKIGRIESLNYLSIDGNVNLKSPDVVWWYIEFWGLNPKAVPELPEDILFGRWLGNGQRHLIKELSLKTRKFIGNTSMEPQLSLLMANQALVQRGHVIFDPFVGTGSLLVSAAKFGAYVMGADIDFLTIHARSRPSRISQKVREKDESIRENLKQYGCQNLYIDVIVSDFSNPIWRDVIRFDAIITDPPYGIREATERIETKHTSKPNTKTEDMPHYPSTSHYALQHLFEDLLLFAAKHLKIGGRLVCWLPFHREDYTPKMIPRHKNLVLIANTEQLLTGLVSRRLLTYEKQSEPVIDNTQSLIIEEPLPVEFRGRYFDSGLESRAERRMRKAVERERGRLEAIKRGKVLLDGKNLKCELNKARFS